MPSLKRPAALFLSSALGIWSCAKDPARSFPIGLYDVDDPRFLQEVAANGFDSVYGNPTGRDAQQSFAREAARRGIRLLAWAPQPGLSAAEVRTWPLLAWYIQDEPDVHGVSPSDVEAVSRSWGSRPQVLVIGDGAAAERYGRIADILMLDWYPVPHLNLDSVAEQLDTARRFIPKDKPLWMAVQAMDWKDFAQRDPTKARIGRFPDDAEMRFMSYLAVLHGARGLFYYTFKKPGGRTLLDFPEQWQALTRVTREMRAIQPILEDGRRIPLPYAPAIDSVEAAAWRYHGRDYVVVLNRRPDVMQRFPEELLDAGWRPLFEVRRDPRDLLEKVGDAWFLRPYRVLVLESGLRWGAPAIKTW